MVLTKHRPRHDEVLVPVEKPRGVPARPLAARPGISRDVLDELRAETASPTALREAFDRPAGTWLPATVGMRAVPLTAVPVDDIDTVLADIAAVAAAHPDALRHPDVLIALGIALCDAITAQSDAEQLAEVAV